MPRRLKRAEIDDFKREQLARQKFKCPICGGPLGPSLGPDVVLDHDHTLGFCRAVLCRNCNGVEGKIRNLCTRGRRGRPYVEFLRRIARYWEIFEEIGHNRPLHPLHKTPDEKRELRNKRARDKRRKAKEG